MPVQLVNDQVLLKNNASDENQSARFFRFSFSVPAGCGKLVFRMQIHSAECAQIPVVLFDAKGNVRIMRAANATIGDAVTEYALAPGQADEGCIPGLLPAGQWKLILYKRRLLESVIEARLSVFAYTEKEVPPSLLSPAPLVQALAKTPFSGRRVREGPGWYCGELHTHSSESTGHTPIAEVVEAAAAQKLDFLAVTDHFTASHWLKLQALQRSGGPLMLQSMEISGDFGHANVHGLTSWKNPLVDDNQELTAFLGLKEHPSMESIADETHREGGLFCINHALSGIMGWRYRDFPMEKADLYEVFCTPEMQTSILYPTHWDMFLTRGLHLTGVGSSDSHHPTAEGPWKLGRVRTWVYARELSQKALLEALKRGRAYVAILGARMELSASAGDKTAFMGDTLPLDTGDTAEFTVDLIEHPAGNLFIYADGLILDTIYYDHSGRDVYRFSLGFTWLRENADSYIRIEFHEMKDKPAFYGMAYRDHLSARLISNPIWLTRKG